MLFRSPAKKTWADMIRGGGQAKPSAKAAAAKATPAAGAKATAPAQMTPRPAAAVDDAQDQPPKKESEEAETSASGDDEINSRSTDQMTKSAIQEEVPKETFQAWKEAKAPKAQSIPENVQAEASPAAPVVARVEEARPAARKKLTNAKLAPVKKQQEPEDEADMADALEAEKAEIGRAHV